MTADLVIDGRFNGPARSANGGFACGSLAERVPRLRRDPLGHTVEVTLRRPPPLGTVLRVTQRGDATLLSEGEHTDEHTVAEGRVVQLDLAPVEPVAADVAAQATLASPGLSAHPFPACFVCGPERGERDGLRIFPGPVSADRGFVGSLWVPHSVDGSAGQVDVTQPSGFATTWAALDCVGGWSGDLEGRPCVLGRMTARVDALPIVDEPHVVVGRHLGSEGRKAFTASTLYDAAGRAVALARHIWIQVDPAAFN